MIKHKLMALDAPRTRDEGRPGNWDVAHALKTVTTNHDHTLIKLCPALDALYPNDCCTN